MTHLNPPAVVEGDGKAVKHATPQKVFFTQEHDAGRKLR